MSGRRQPLGKRALDILSVLATARGEIVTKDELLEAVWPGLIVEENALQVHIVALRKALGPEAERLRTIRGVGYQLDIDGAATSSPAALVASGDSTLPAASAPAPHRPALMLPRLFRSNLGAIAGAVALLLAMVGTWWFAGPSLGLRSQTRIPVVVRALTASGSGDSTEAALANGITDELIVRLRRLPELRVATADVNGTLPRGSFQSAYVVDGTIRRSGDQLRVTARLSDADGEILWSQTFERRLRDLFEVQETTAASIADVLGVSLDVGAQATDHGGTDNPEAFAAYLEFTATQLNPDQSVPRRHLERALALDPHYIKALAGLAVSYALESNWAETNEQALAALAKADEISQRAVAANPRLWIGHEARGYYFANSRDYGASQRSFQRVEQFDRGIDPGLRASLASAALGSGQIKKAIALYNSIKSIDPARRFDGAMVQALSNLGRHEEAIALYEEQVADDPVNVSEHGVYIFLSYLALNREEDAILFADQYLPGWSDKLRAFKADKALRTMSRAELEQWAARQYGEGGYVDLVSTALLSSQFGQSKLAVDLLRIAYERPAGGFGGVAMWYAAMANARQTDEFEQLVADLGMVKVWRETGDWPDACRPVSATEITCA